MKEVIPPRYDIKEVEERIYKLWEKSGFFNPDNLKLPKSAPPFSVVLPPPNVTGELHMGHAAMLAVEDIMVRYARMKGMRTLWLPGTDHAAIATQSKVEKDIYKKEGKSRHDLGREEFLRRVEEFASKSHDYIVHQIKRMGASLDWSREAFTLDSERGEAVVEAFKRMYERGLIYRGERIVNWDPKMQTTVSDDEIEWIEEQSPFYYLKYGPFEIGTARPETKFGDKYVVVHPDDKRYKKYKHGEKLEVDWMNGKITATVIKDKAVDMKFGTGAMTITPSHDNADFEIAERHKLDREQIIDTYGKLLPIAGEFAGMKIKEARGKIVEKSKQMGLLTRVDENYTHRVAISSRGAGVIEPQVMRQWFVSVGSKFEVRGSKLRGIKNGQKYSLKDLMRQAVKSGEIRISPTRFKKIYFHWIDNLRDWCISRQIWYGHRVPVWYLKNSKVKSQNAKLWSLKIYGEDIFRAIENGTKKIEIRAGRPRGEGKYWGDFKPGDIIEFSLADEKNDEIIRSVKPIQKIVKRVSHFEAIEEMLKTYEASDNYPGRSEEEVKDWWRTRPVLWERIQKHGIWAIELIDKLQEEIYVGVNSPKGQGWEQDPDTLDTWFSSGLWTFSTLGWPAQLLQSKTKAGKPFADFKKAGDLATFHPTSILETGYDIIFFWVARMILMSTYLMGEVPFKKVYLHGLVRDMQGRKMSKTLGNGIDPLEMADKYGADAARLSLIIGAGPGNDMKLSEDKIRGYRNFATKIWNAARFVMMSKKSEFEKAKVTLSPADKKDLAQLKKIKTEVTKHLEKYEFHLAGEKLYHYFWHEFADEIIESSKPRLSSKNQKDAAAAYSKLETILKESLKMLHPFIPFVTEEIWQKLKPGELLMVERW